MHKDWSELGIEWKDVTVTGKDENDVRHTYVGGQRLTVSDYAKFKAALGDDRVLALLSQSLNQISTDKSREGLSAKDPWSRDTIRESIFGRIMGTRGGVKTVVVKVRPNVLPDSTEYEGSDEVEFRQTVMAQFVDMGLPVPKAQALAESYKWNAPE